MTLEEHNKRWIEYVAKCESVIEKHAGKAASERVFNSIHCELWSLHYETREHDYDFVFIGVRYNKENGTAWLMVRPRIY